MDRSQNPFNITKAVDFSDREIVDFWVDMPVSGFAALAKPKSHMPMFILGGKGSGKTHVMRYYAYEAQKERNTRNDLLAQTINQGFLGLYFRCRGLNAHRFSGKGQSTDVWDAVFAFYMDLWLSHLLLHTVIDLLGQSHEFAASESKIVQGIRKLLVMEPSSGTVQAVMNSIDSTRKKLDLEINNCAISKSLTAIRITSNPGDLVFGLPKMLAEHLPSLSDMVFVYLIDELENLTERQQRYVNTLVREKEPPASFKIGSRLYGLRTFSTLSADEENKEGSEFETLYLDDHLRGHPADYRGFCERLVIKRLTEYGYLPRIEESSQSTVAAYFEDLPDDRGLAYYEYFDRMLLGTLSKPNRKDNRPYRTNFRRKLEDCPDADSIVQMLRVDDSPFLERINMFSFYKLSQGKKEKHSIAKQIASECAAFREAKRSDTIQGRQIDKFGRDILAQLMRECDQPPQYYVGFGEFVKMSDGLPRHLLVVLKDIYKWALFNGEEPFGQNKISISSQISGVKQAAEWFYHDARIAGPLGDDVRKGIRRLATLLREVRYSDKPAECSCVSFNGDLSNTTEACRNVLDAATKWSMLVKLVERRDKNSQATLSRFRLSPMLSPLWDLPLSSRGSLTLNSEEINSIFDPASDNFSALVKKRLSRMTYSGRGNGFHDIDELGLFGDRNV